MGNQPKALAELEKEMDLRSFAGSIMADDSLALMQQHAIDDWVNYKDRLKYQFSVQTQGETELLSLTIQDFAHMRTEYDEAF